MCGASVSTHSLATTLYPLCMGRWSVHPLRANSVGSASKSMFEHSSSSSKLPLPSPESLSTEPRRNEKDPERDRPTMASRPDAVTGFEDSRMF